MPKRIASIMTDMFEDSEYTEPAKAFRDNGHEVITLGLKKGERVTGKSENTGVVIDKAVSEVSVDDFDALLIPGGYSPDKLRIHDDVVNFTADFVNSGKPVFAICHAGQLLITAQVLAGRQFTGYASIAQDIKNAGAEFIDKEVVVDDNMVSSRNPDDIPAFIRESLKMLES